MIHYEPERRPLGRGEMVNYSRIKEETEGRWKQQVLPRLKSDIKEEILTNQVLKDIGEKDLEYIYARCKDQHSFALEWLEQKVTQLSRYYEHHPQIAEHLTGKVLYNALKSAAIDSIYFNANKQAFARYFVKNLSEVREEIKNAPDETFSLIHKHDIFDSKENAIEYIDGIIKELSPENQYSSKLFSGSEEIINHLLPLHIGINMFDYAKHIYNNSHSHET